MCKENKIEYLGETPDEVKLKKFEAAKCYRKQAPYLSDKASCPGYTHDRGAQISRWISQQKFTGEYIVLDDETQDILPWIPEGHVVQTTLWEGLTENKVEESIKKLLN